MNEREGGLDGSMISRTARRGDYAPLVDERVDPRFAGLVDDAVLTATDREQLVRVVNIGAQGAMITPALPLRIGEKVELRLAGNLRVPGAVRWIRDGRMGINFAAPLVIETP